MRFYFFLIMLASAALATAQSQQRVTITHATVFLTGAELTSTARITLPQGESEIVFTNVAGNVNAQSLNIGADGKVLVQSATFQNNYLTSQDSLLTPQGKKIKDSLTYFTSESVRIGDKKTVIAEQIAVLKANQTVGGANTGLSVLELQKMLDLVNTRLTALLADDRRLSEQLLTINERKTRLTAQLDEERKKDYQPGGQLLVRFFAPQAATSNISISYVVPNAGWTPSYDLRVDKVNDPVKLLYKAFVYQNSGVKWSGVKLSLSTGNPSEGVEAPVLNPWYLSYQQAVANYGGSRTNEISLNRSRAYDEAAATGKAAGDRDDVYPTSISDYVAVDNSGINTSFDIDLPYDIPSDGQQHSVAIQDYQLPATYRYFAVPKIDKDAFLQAQITDWEDLNLLPASTNVFFEGSYVGQGFIDMRNVRDTMNLSLGRDKKIIIRREKDKSYQSEKTVGTNERQAFAYTTTVRNTRKESVKIVVLDQYPVSSDDDIVVEDKEAPDATVDAANGAVKWTIDVKPAEARKLKMSYTVKYPRGKTISNLR